MIINSSRVKLNISLAGIVHENLSLEKVDSLLGPFKNQEILPKQMISIPNCHAVFCSDVDNNKFDCKVYRTTLGNDRWIMLMKDDFEGYALYENPVSRKMELAWYHRKLDEPLSQEEEKKMITCYVPEF